MLSNDFVGKIVTGQHLLLRRLCDPHAIRFVPVKYPDQGSYRTSMLGEGKERDPGYE